MIDGENEDLLDIRLSKPVETTNHLQDAVNILREIDNDKLGTTALEVDALPETASTDDQ